MQTHWLLSVDIDSNWLQSRIMPIILMRPHYPIQTGHQFHCVNAVTSYTQTMNSVHLKVVIFLSWFWHNFTFSIVHNNQPKSFDSCQLSIWIDHVLVTTNPRHFSHNSRRKKNTIFVVWFATFSFTHNFLVDRMVARKQHPINVTINLC